MTVLRTEPEPLVIMVGLRGAVVAAVEEAATPVLDSLRIGATRR